MNNIFIVYFAFNCLLFCRIAVNGEKGGSFATSGEDLFLLGTFQSDAVLKAAGQAEEQGHQVLGRISSSALLNFDFSALQVQTLQPVQPSTITRSGQNAQEVATSVGTTAWARVYQNSNPSSSTNPLSPVLSAITTPTSMKSSSLSSSPPRDLFAPMISEASWHFDALLQEWVVVSLSPFVDKRIHVCRTADLLSATPWQCSYLSRGLDVWDENSDILTYAAKAHPVLLSSSKSKCKSNYYKNGKLNSKSNNSKNSNDQNSSGGAGAGAGELELIISTVTNTIGSRDAGTLFQGEYKAAYVPKFLLIKTHTKISTDTAGGNGAGVTKRMKLA